MLECNPNICELLGLDEDQYLVKTEISQELIDHTELFLTKRAVKSFGGYAGAQLRRLQNAIARDTMEQPERERHIGHGGSHHRTVIMTYGSYTRENARIICVWMKRRILSTGS